MPHSDPGVIQHLQTQLTNELTAVNQFQNHALLLHHWGVTKLARKAGVEAQEEREHADELIARILYLGGTPDLGTLNTVLVGADVRGVLEADLKLEEKALRDVREGIGHCEAVRDYVSRDLLLRILADEEGHEDFLLVQMELIRQIGIERYIQLNAAPAPEQGRAKPAK